MTSPVERLTGLVDAADRYDLDPAELIGAQLEAANERFVQNIDNIKLLANRAETAGLTRVGDRADLVPLLFEHTAYKSYPEAWLNDGKWDRMGRWLNTVSAQPVPVIDTQDITGIDDWLERLAAAGHYLSCSSGTTGKVSMINSSAKDREFNRHTNITSLAWSTGQKPDHSFKFFSCNPSSNNFRTNDVVDSIADAFGNGESEYHFPGGTMTIGGMRRMIELRHAIGEGTALPAEIAAYEQTSLAREQAMDDAVGGLAELLIANRGEKLMMIGMFPLLYRVTDAIRSLGYSRKDFHPANTLITGGGLKRAALPDDYREQIFGTLNISGLYHMYAMQEINTQLPRCTAGRYHVPPWLMLLILNDTGEELAGPAEGEVEGRAAFFDLSHDGRWGGVMTGDKVRADYGKCACGHQGPTIDSEIMRYADMAGGDKITCSGTVDAYVRGIA